MATKICPNCGTPAGMEARFCRSCGTSLKGADAEENPASPMAATVPLTDYERAAASDDGSKRARETVRVEPDEADELLRRDRRGDEQNDVQSTLHSEEVDPEATLIRRSSATSTLAPPSVVNSAPVDHAETSPNFTGRGESSATPPVLIDQPESEATQVNAVAGNEIEKDRGARWWQWAVVGASLLVAAAAILLVARSFRQPAPSNADAPQVETGGRLPTISDRLADAERLLAAGDVEAAIKGLREAVALDPANAGARRLLGDALLQAGRRAEAIEEYRQTLVNDPQNRAVWSKLASAQFAEGRYAEAAGSYERLAALPGGARLGDEVQLQRAEALRLAGRNEEAKTIYRQLSTSSSASIAERARGRLAELSAQEANPSPTTGQAGQGEGAALQPPAAPPPATAASPSAPPPPPGAAANGDDSFARAEALWRQNRGAAVAEFRRAAAAGNADAYYYLGLNIAEGRDPKDLPRAELLAALQYFQNARTRGNRYQAQARQYEERLNAEYGRRLGQ